MVRDEMESNNGPSGSGTPSLRRKYLSKDILDLSTGARAHFHNDAKIFHFSNYSLMKIFCVLNFCRLMSVTIIFYR